MNANWKFPLHACLPTPTLFSHSREIDSMVISRKLGRLTLRSPAPESGKGDVPPGDGYTWKKYGRKTILHSKFLRFFFFLSFLYQVLCNFFRESFIWPYVVYKTKKIPFCFALPVVISNGLELDNLTIQNLLFRFCLFGWCVAKIH